MRNATGFENVAGMWSKTSEAGVDFLSGKIELPGGYVLRVTLFPNKHWVEGGSMPQFILSARSADLAELALALEVDAEPQPELNPF